MSDMSNYLEDATYTFWFRPAVEAPVRPTGHFMSLWSAVVDAEAGIGTEFTPGLAPGYVRSQIVFTPPIDGGGFNHLPVEFPDAIANWPQATHFAVHDQLGNMLGKIQQLAQPHSVIAGNHARWEPGDLQITFA